MRAGEGGDQIGAVRAAERSVAAVADVGAAPPPSSCARTASVGGRSPASGSVARSPAMASTSAALPSGDQSLQRRAAGAARGRLGEPRRHRRLGQQRQDRRAVLDRWRPPAGRCAGRCWASAPAGRARARRKCRRNIATASRRVGVTGSLPLRFLIAGDSARDIGVLSGSNIRVMFRLEIGWPRRPRRDRSRREAQRDPDRLLGRSSKRPSNEAAAQRGAADRDHLGRSDRASARAPIFPKCPR